MPVSLVIRGGRPPNKCMIGVLRRRGSGSVKERIRLREGIHCYHVENIVWSMVGCLCTRNLLTSNYRMRNCGSP